MILKKGNEYLDFNGDIEIDQQVASVETLDTVGTFSYSFSLPPTIKNKRLLGITSYDVVNKRVFTQTDDVELQTDLGMTLLTGSLLVTDTLAISCSFVSGNTTFFNSIQGKIADTDLSDFDVYLNEANITNSWTKNDGVVFPLVDRGQLSLRKDAFMKMRKFNGLVYQNDWQPFVYIKSTVQRCLQKSGLKIAGDLVNDATYSSLITTNNSTRFFEQKIKETNVFVGKTTPQTISDAGYTKISFEDATSGMFYTTIKNSWDYVNNKWNVPFDCTIAVTFTLQTSDATKLINISIRRSGTLEREDFNLKGLLLSGTTSSTKDPLGHPQDFHSNANDAFELWAQVDSSTPGSVTILSGTFLGEVQKTSFIFAQQLLPDQDAKDFIKEIFRLFNVVCSFDSYTKTINTKFFKNIVTSTEQDYSRFIDSYNAENGFELVSGYAQSNNVTYKDDSTQEIINYNNANIVPYGAGQIKISNKFLNITSDLFQSNFTAAFSQFYPAFGVQLIKLNFSEYVTNEDPDESDSITSVTNSSGDAQFNGAIPYIVHNNPFTVNAQGLLALDENQSLKFNEIQSDAQILALHITNVAIPKTFRFSEGFNGNDWYLYRLYNFTTQGYNGDWELKAFASVTHTNASIAVFATSIDGTELDAVNQGLSFGPIANKQSLTLLGNYYSNFISSVNDPVKLLANMYIPEKEFVNFDFLKPVRLKTKNFNSLFFCQKIRGYKNSSTPCIMELVKIN